MHRVLKIPGGGGAGCPSKLAGLEQGCERPEPNATGRALSWNVRARLAREHGRGHPTDGALTGIGEGTDARSLLWPKFGKVRLLGQAGLLFL